MPSARHRLYAHLRDLATQGRVCPTNAVIGETLGISAIHVSKVLAELRDMNRIAVRKAGSRRIVTILSEGIETADPAPVLGPIAIRPRVREILETASQVFDVPVKDIMSGSRKRRHARPRHAVCFVGYRRGWSSPQIGRGIGREHSTVRYGRERAAEIAVIDLDYAAKVDELLERSPVRAVGA